MPSLGAPLPWGFNGQGHAGGEPFSNGVGQQQSVHEPVLLPPPPPPAPPPPLSVNVQQTPEQPLLQPLPPSSDWNKLQQRVSGLRAALTASQQTAGNYKEQVCNARLVQQYYR